MTDLPVAWRHYTGTANEEGIVWVSSANEAGTHAMSGGGFATAATSSSTQTNGSAAGASGLAPLVASYPEYDSGTDTSVWTLGFAAAPGSQLRTHVFAVLAEEA